MRALVWFRRDLRVDDNAALASAAEFATDGIVAVYFVTPQQWIEHDEAPCKIKFWLDHLESLSAKLAELNIPLLIEQCDSFLDVPKRILKLAQNHDCSDLFFNHEYEANEQQRDQHVIDQFELNDLNTHCFHDRVVVPPETIKTKEGKFYSVFTPYRKVWDRVAEEYLKTYPRPKQQKPLDIKPGDIPDKVKGFDLEECRSDLWPAGEDEAQARLEKFKSRIGGYNDYRDIPSLNGTSLLSPYLAVGAISIRQCLNAAIELNEGRIAGAEGPTTWISELTWRDFYVQVMVACPRVSKHQPFKLKTNQLQWRNDPQEFQAWCDGQTGYPIVDAGMRQLNRTGWMHNRLRMVTAMFLTKNLLIDWRMGEKYFMQKLIDGDLASNNGGWQWSASTGTDAVPYFRIFNPFSQSKRFDPEGDFIRKMCPELKKVPKKSLHDVKKMASCRPEFAPDYPEYIVDYSHGRERALQAFKALK